MSSNRESHSDWFKRSSGSPDYDRPVFGSGGPVVLTFGKHRGRTLDQVPGSYLVWLSGLDSIDEGLRDAAVDEVMLRRAAHQILSGPSGSAPSVPANPRPEGARPTRAERALMSPEDAKACRAEWRNHR